MKFTELTSKFNTQVSRSEKGKKVKIKEINQLITLLEEKHEKYVNKLKTDLSDKKRESFETKLQVVETHLNKVRALSRKCEN